MVKKRGGSADPYDASCFPQFPPHPVEARVERLEGIVARVLERLVSFATEGGGPVAAYLERVEGAKMAERASKAEREDRREMNKMEVEAKRMECEMGREKEREQRREERESDKSCRVCRKGRRRK